jgi:hypothetical protein
MAVLGGLVLGSLILLTCLSVAGRVLNTLLHGQVGALAPAASQWLLDLGVGPILGDFELVEAGVAFAIFAFIPLCQVTAGHATVDILTNLFSRRMNRFLQMLIEIAFAVALILIAWKLFDGMMSKRRYGETTFLLEFPIWWSYAASLFAAVVGAIAGVYMAAARCYEFFWNRTVVQVGAEAGR